MLISFYSSSCSSFCPAFALFSSPTPSRFLLQINKTISPSVPRVPLLSFLPFYDFPCLPNVETLQISGTELNTKQMTTLLSHFPALTQMDMGCGNFRDLTWLAPVKNTLQCLTIEPFPTFHCPASKLLFLKQMPQIIELTLTDGHDTDEDDPPLDELHIEALMPPSRIVPNLEYGRFNGHDYHWPPNRSSNSSSDSSSSSSDSDSDW